MKKYFYFYILTIFLVAWYVFNFLAGERIPINNSLGWDGIFYARLAQNFGSYFHNMSYYYSGRVFPSLMVSQFAKLFFYSLDLPQNIINAFYLYDILVILLGIYFFYRIAKYQQWSFPSFLIGFTALFCNYAIIKNMPYYPNLTDYTALTVGLATLYFYLHNNLPGLLATTFVGAFTFPTILLSNSLLVLFPIRSTPSTKSISIPLPQILVKSSWSTPALSGILSILIIVFTYRALLVDFHQTAIVVIISAIGLFSYLSLLMRPFIKDRISLNTHIVRLFYIIVMTSVISLIKIKYLVDPNSPVGLTIWGYLNNIMIESVFYPIVFLVGHYVFFGPAILVMIFLWPTMVKISYEAGFGLFLFTLLYGLLSIESESRQLINALPIFVFLLCQGLDDLKISFKFAYSLLAISLVTSKFWLPMNLFPWPAEIHLQVEDLHAWPQQLFFMNFGPGMAAETYLIQLTVMLIVFCGLYVWKYRYFSRTA